MRRSFVLLGLAGVLSLGACKGDLAKCEKSCRNYATLVYWEKADSDVAAAPAAERSAMKRKYLDKFQRELEGGVDLCINQCSSANNDESMDCMIKAKTAKDAHKCNAKDD